MFKSRALIKSRQKNKRKIIWIKITFIKLVSHVHLLIKLFFTKKLYGTRLPLRPAMETTPALTGDVWCHQSVFWQRTVLTGQPFWADPSVHILSPCGAATSCTPLYLNDQRGSWAPPECWKQAKTNNQHSCMFWSSPFSLRRRLPCVACDVSLRLKDRTPHQTKVTFIKYVFTQKFLFRFLSRLLQKSFHPSYPMPAPFPYLENRRRKCNRCTHCLVMPQQFRVDSSEWKS